MASTQHRRAVVPPALLGLAALAVLLAPAALAVDVPADLSTWQQEGRPENGSWDLASDDLSVVQTADS
ncbi:MAG TPA: hypothetical protein VGR28_08910, partial [Candidatus Thermoplasmatota archaeon]|nr:hypothetical protein [Candidatus Thermoplasmatota archaeon]